MFRLREIVILTVLIIFCLMGSSAATKEISHIDITINTAKSNLNYGLNIPKHVNITKTTPAKFNIKKVIYVTISNRQVNDSGCCSVLVHIKSDMIYFHLEETLLMLQTFILSVLNGMVKILSKNIRLTKVIFSIL